jgi:hypothetical protein
MKNLISTFAYYYFYFRRHSAGSNRHAERLG